MNNSKYLLMIVIELTILIIGMLYIGFRIIETLERQTFGNVMVRLITIELVLSVYK